MTLRSLATAPIRCYLASALLLALAFFASSCAGEKIADETTTTGSSSSDVADAQVTSTSTSTSTSTTTSTSRTPSTTTSTSTPTSNSIASTLPGEPIFSLPKEGDVLGVMGVAYDDVLNIRAIPGAATDIVGSAASTATNLEATGEARKLPTTIWYQVRAPGVTGWVNSSYVGFVGGTDDATAEFLSRSSPPQAGTLAELGRIVAEGFASDEPPSRIVQSVVSTEGDVGEVVYDVIGLGDDSVVGFRLHIFGVRTEDGAGFGLGSIERTVFCFRGLAGELCT